MRAIRASAISLVGIAVVFGFVWFVFRFSNHPIIRKYQNNRKEFEGLASQMTTSRIIPPSLPKWLRGLDGESIAFDGDALIFAFETPSPDAKRCLVYNYQAGLKGHRVVELIVINESWAYVLLI